MKDIFSRQECQQSNKPHLLKFISNCPLVANKPLQSHLT